VIERGLDLAFIGFGNVARRAASLLEEMRARLSFRVRTVAVVTSRHGAAASDDGLDVRAALERVDAGGRLDAWPASLPAPATAGGSNAHVVTAIARRHHDASREGRLVCIETTVLDVHAGEPATSHVRAALQAGAHAVTANKGPVAFAYAELAALARSAGREFLFEGAVMDGIPVFNLVREALPGVRVDRFRGVINSTTNHILTRLEQGESFDDALARMQRDGVAEADPSLDVDGWDAAAKTAALMNVLMDARVTPRDIEREGIRGVRHADVRAAIDAGSRLRLVASADGRGSGATGRVRLERVPAHDPLGSLEGQQNALLLGTDLLGEVGVLQRDGGLTQTAYAIVSDLATIARRRPS
jgi:homoserine dehydrogenase